MKNYLKYLLIAASIIAIMVSVRSCVAYKKKFEVAEKSTVDLLKKEELKIIDKEKKITQANTIILQRDREVEKLLDSLNNMGSVETVTRVKIVTKIDTVLVPFKEENEIQTVVLGDSILLPPGDYLRLPSGFEVNDEWYSLKLEVNNRGLSINELKFKNDLSITLGTKKKGLKFWKKDKTVVQVRDLNPNSSVGSIESFKVIDDTRPKNFNFGIQAGYGVIGTATGYYIGVGLNYSLIKF